ncbi:MAG: threonine--tRNA ligase [Acidiferrobacter sp.]
MPVITLPDGSRRTYPQPVTVAEVAADIGPGLAKAALAGRVDGRLVDTSTTIATDTHLAIITARDPEGLEVIRHSTAHLLAQAVKGLFPEAQVTIGPVIEDGFYYDFAYAPGFSHEDLARIEARMQELAHTNTPVRREVVERAAAIQYFEGLGETYKAEIIRDLPVGEEISLYRQGDFVDLCRGPHVPSTGSLKHFKLMKLAGAYWRGDARNPMLQRIYGTAFGSSEALAQYVTRREEAERRDHRRIGRALDLFHIQEEAPGMVFWHDRGLRIYQIIEQYIRRLLRQHGYEEVRTPLIMDRSLWERSGHWDKFAEGMFTTASEKHEFAVKPMNCPGAVQIFNQGLKSYRDLPLRLAEFGSCHRNEPSGTLHGLLRLRNFVQDDGHIFCTEGQIQAEVGDFIDLLFHVYRDFGFHDVLVKLSTRPAQRVGREELWDRAEAALAEALAGKALTYDLQPGEGAFYGPKIEFSLKDSLGRVWQCGTVQVDFAMPERLGAVYIEADSHKAHPVMLHRAILGSLERFIGILLEEHGGALPLWLAPVQAVVLPIADRHAVAAQGVEAALCAAAWRVESDLRNEKIGFKIREHTLQKVPYLLVVGDREVEGGTISVRTREGVDLGSMTVGALVAQVGARGISPESEREGRP